jgi:hypothetical protein
MSAHRYLHVIDIMKDDNIDEELIEWIREAHDKERKQLKTV